MVIIFFIFLCICVVLIVGVSAHFARKVDDPDISEPARPTVDGPSGS